MNDTRKDESWSEWVGKRTDMLRTIHNENIFKAGYDAALEALRTELAQEREKQEPAFWYRPRSDGLGYEGPLHNESIERVRKLSGGWVPLYAGAAPHTAPQPASSYKVVPPNTSGEANCTVRWMIETDLGWVGAYDKEALTNLLAAVPQTPERQPLTDDQLLEQCALICESHKVGLPSYFEIDKRLQECADEIRAISE